MEVGKHVVGLILQLGHCPSWSWDVDAWIRRLNALVADLLEQEKEVEVEVQGKQSPV